MVQLTQTGSPITREERNKINENWNRIVAGFLNHQRQINFLAGTEVELLIERIDVAVNSAETTADEMAILMGELETALQNAQVALNASNNATADAIQATTDANQAANDTNNAIALATQATTDANNATADAIQATTDAIQATTDAIQATTDATSATALATQATTDTNNATALTIQATTDANQAVQDVRDSIAAMLTDIDNYKISYEHKSTYLETTRYYKNNEVLYLGSTFRAKQDTVGNAPPTDFTSNNYWQLVARRGEDVQRSEDLAKVWRGVNPPSDLTAIWWSDPDAPEDKYVYIRMGDLPPTDTRNLWLAPREEVTP